MLKITVLGASGRMGRAVLRCIAESDDLEVAGAVTESTDPAMGCDAGEASGVDSLGVPLTDDRENGLHEADAAIDFTLPSATEAKIRACVKAGVALVIGTTGLETQQLKAMEIGAEEIPLVYGRNMSIGMNVFMDLVSQAALTLDEDYDVEIIEAHHRQKVDAPSGTALALGERLAEAKGHRLEDLAVYERHGQIGPRVPGMIGFSVIRAGNIVGNHSVVFGGPEESIELTHRATDRMSFARGAVRAARWAAGRASGLYSMADVLGLLYAKVHE